MALQTGLKKHYPDIGFGLTRVKQSDIDEYYQYCIMKPAVGTADIVGVTVGTSLIGTVAINYPDYPRSLLVGWADASGTTFVGTAVITGSNQFGKNISETFVNTTGGTTNVQGTKVYAYVGTLTLSHAAGAAGDSVTVGYGIAAGTAKFGLPNKVAGSADVRRVTWVDNGSTKQGTATIDHANHAFLPKNAVSATDDYVVTMRANYVTDDDHECEMTNATLITNA